MFSPLKQYGGEEHLAAPPKELLLAQTEQYVEYSKHGRLIKGKLEPFLATTDVLSLDSSIYPTLLI